MKVEITGIPWSLYRGSISEADAIALRLEYLRTFPAMRRWHMKYRTPVGGWGWAWLSRYLGAYRCP